MMVTARLDTHLNKEGENIVVKNSVFIVFMVAFNKTKAPNQTLLEAAQCIDESGIKSVGGQRIRIT